MKKRNNKKIKKDNTSKTRVSDRQRVAVGRYSSWSIVVVGDHN